jgi:hypothetical protein
MDAVKTILMALGGISVVSSLMSAWAYFLGDRSGNSGRHKHWSEED